MSDRRLCSHCWFTEHTACVGRGCECPHPDQPWTQLNVDVKAGDSLTTPTVVGQGWCVLAGEEMTEGSIIVQGRDGMAWSWPLDDGETA